jgi:hypothetical protein
MNTQLVDPWESANEAKPPQFSNEVWGQVEARSWYCVLEKGTGKVEFNPDLHSPDQRRTAIEIVVHPLPDMGLTFDITRSMIAESHEWASIVLPSIRDLGLHPRALNGQWVKVANVTLTDRKGAPVTYTDSNGIEKERKTIKFLKLFSSEDECRADYLASSGKHSAVNTQQNEKMDSNSGDKERQTALSFLRVFVQNACRGQSDIDAIRKLLASQLATQPLISKFFTVDSPETVELIAQCLGGSHV